MRLNKIQQCHSLTDSVTDILHLGNHQQCRIVVSLTDSVTDIHAPRQTPAVPLPHTQCYRYSYTWANSSGVVLSYSVTNTHAPRQLPEVLYPLQIVLQLLMHLSKHQRCHSLTDSVTDIHTLRQIVVVSFLLIPCYIYSPPRQPPAVSYPHI